MASKRPEQVAPADIFYNESEAKKYAANTRMISIQRELTERALEILAIPEIWEKRIYSILDLSQYQFANGGQFDAEFLASNPTLLGKNHSKSCNNNDTFKCSK